MAPAQVCSFFPRISNAAFSSNVKKTFRFPKNTFYGKNSNIKQASGSQLATVTNLNAMCIDDKITGYIAVRRHP